MLIGGNWTDNSGGFEPNLGTVYFYGPNDSQITTDETFYNLVVDKSNTHWYNLNLNTGLTLTVLNDLTTIDGTLNLDNNSTLIVGNDVLFGLNSGLNAYYDMGIEIFVGGNWTNENTLWDTFIGYSPGTETLTFNGSSDQFFTSNASREEVGTLVIDKSGGQFRPASNINVKGDLLIENKEWHDNVSGLTHYFEGDFTVSATGGYFTASLNNTAVFKGAADQSITYGDPGYGYFCNILIDKTDWPVDQTQSGIGELKFNQHTSVAENRNQVVTMYSTVIMQGGDGLIVDEGTLLVNGNTLSTMGDVEINDGGRIEVDANARLTIYEGDVLRVNDGGIIDIVGSPTFPATISHRFEGYFGFEVNAGGYIIAEDAIFEYIGVDIYGLHVKQDAMVSPGYCFHGCEFRYGNGSIGTGALLTINNDQDFTAYNASFPDAATQYNIAKDYDWGHVLFYEATGDFAGEDFEFDNYGRIDWFEPDLEVLPLTRNVSAPAGSTTFDISTTLDWTVTESVPWLTVVPMNGNGDATLTVNYTENTAVTTRSGEITVSADGVDDVVVTVVQAGAEPVLTVTPPTRNVSAPAGSTTFGVGSNTSWTVSESAPWFDVVPMGGTGNGTLTVNYTQNTSVLARSGQITVSSAGIPDVIVAVNQAGADEMLTVTPGNQNVSPPAGSTSFSITSNTGWAVSEGIPWISVSPMNGIGNGVINVSYGENATGSTRIGSITVTATGGIPPQTVTVTQASYPTHTISLADGWSGLSSYIMPANNAIEDVFDPVLADFIIAQTMTGIYYPAGPVNTIIDWESQSAYKLKMDASAMLPLIGNEETNKTLTLSSGWGLIPVICNYPVDAATTLALLDLEVAKDVAGTGVLWPDMSINTLGNLDPGMAYYVLLNSVGSITYPANSDVAVVVNPTVVKLPENPWNELRISPSSHLIAIGTNGMEDILPGDVIGVFSTDGNCYGVSQVGNSGQNMVISVFADDMTTTEKDGFENGDTFNLKLYSPESGKEYDLEVVYDQNMPQGMFFVNEGLSAISHLKLSSSGIAGHSSGISIYPNPTNDIVLVTGVKGFDEIAIINNTGTVLHVQPTNEQDKVSIDMSAFSNGIYQLKLIGVNSTVIRKVIKN